ncbi:MAG: spore germination protein [Limnochordales bacterium]|nr:spore germination protein [Limnochordales bacterium]
MILLFGVGVSEMDRAEYSAGVAGGAEDAQMELEEGDLGGGPAGGRPSRSGGFGGSAAESARYPLTPSLDKNLQVLRQRLGFGVSFDICIQDILISHRRAAVIVIDGLVNGLMVQRLIMALVSRTDPAALERAEGGPLAYMRQAVVGYYETEQVESLDEVVDKVLSGQIALLLDGDARALIIDMRAYPVRSVEEPDLERVTRGARDGFVETVLFNSALIRRRIRDPRLRIEALTAGRRSKTDILLCYIEGIAPQQLVEQLKKRIEEVDADGLPMGSKSLEEYITGMRINPLPIVRYSERPDVVASHLLEGHIAVLVDTTPQAMILPATAFHFLQHSEEYYQSPSVGTYLRWIRVLGYLLSFLLVPVWLGVVTSGPPPSLGWIGPKGEVGIVPLLWQFLTIEIGIDVTRQAFVHTPSPLASSLGVIAAVLLGQFAVEVGLVTNEVILYSAIAAIGFFAIPNLEFALAMRLLRYLAIIPAGIWGIPGVLGGLALILVIFAFTRSFGLPYLWPLIPFNKTALVRALLRPPVPVVGTRTLQGVTDRRTKPPR